MVYGLRRLLLLSGGFGGSAARNLFMIIGILAVSTSAHSSYVGFVTGDSFSNDSNEWPFLLSSSTMYSTAIGGQQLVQMVTTFESQLDQYIADENIDFAIIQGGVNDVSDAVTLDMMQSAVTSMVSTALSREIPTLVMNIAPWTNATQAERDEIDAYNAWLNPIFGAGSQTAVVDIYTPLVDPNALQQLNPIYDSGDGLHPNQAGHLLIADTVDSVIVTFIPIPATSCLFGSGLLGLVGMARRQKA
jgi:lysophospholipase L1-like esterase